MKSPSKKTPLLILFTLLLLPVVFPTVSASPETVVCIDPPSVTVNKGEAFYVNVSVMNVVDLMDWSFKLSWTPGLLNCTAVNWYPPGIIPIPDWPPPGWASFVDNAGGYVLVSQSYTSSISGNFTFAWIWFNATAAGSSNLTLPLSHLLLLDYDAIEISCNVSNGFVEVNEPANDIAVTDIDVFVNPSNYPSVAISGAYESYPTWLVPYKVNVTVKNEGGFTETFNVSALLQNATGNYTIGTQAVNNLAPGATANVIFSFPVPPLPGYNPDPWGPYNLSLAWPYPTYAVWANASIVPGETDTADNELFDGTIKVKWPGDVDGNGEVKLPDLVKLAKAWYGNVATNPSRYNYKCDFNMDGKVDLGDLVKLAKNWYWYKGPLD